MSSFRALGLALLLGGCTGATAPTYALVWSDEFDGPAGSAPDPTSWVADVGTDWGNAQLEYDTDRRSNAALDGDGHLVITARQESFLNRSYSSARLKTLGRRQFQYGRFEARMKMPTGRGLWPAFWLLGADFPVVGWPRSGEIDIMEYRGQEPSVVLASVHGPGYSGGASLTRRYTLPSGRLDDGFHVYRADWTPREIRFYLDDRLYHVVAKGDQPGPWVYDHEFFIILNLAVGGGFVGPPDASTTFPQSLTVDWVRVSQERR
ncbi:MAG: glycoside hydrolase family 16 protein [Gemmatimonadota bacterium]|nr:glycoside hydrolase family 16 protein [Gemmatimonadota bacterium]MDQ8152843.1 glycoside hydrolase family 16 protein [Gemmatimonadota bacterium]MDQ8175161.1 glycoside hydrolase family 16 protein [Gemmatimonadota bacterium]